MIWLKSIGVGLATLCVFAIGAAVFYPAILNTITKSQGIIGVDWLSLLKSSPRLWLLLLLVFAGGLVWQYRRLAR